MLSRISRTILIAVLALALVTPHLAQAQLVGEPLGTIYLSAASNSREGMLTAASFTPFEFYIVADIDYGNIGRPDENSLNGPIAWEASVSIPSSIIVIQAIAHPPQFSINLGTNTNWIVGLGQVFVADGGPWTLVTYGALITVPQAPTDLVIDLGPATPTTFDDSPAPGWVDGAISGECALPNGDPAKCKRIFANVYGLRINCVTDCTVTTEQKSWSSIKANFGG